jgi:hypothetical protein
MLPIRCLTANRLSLAMLLFAVIAEPIGIHGLKLFRHANDPSVLQGLASAFLTATGIVSLLFQIMVVVWTIDFYNGYLGKMDGTRKVQRPRNWKEPCRIAGYDLALQDQQRKALG